MAPGLLSRAKGMLFAPKNEWRHIAREIITPRRLVVGYITPLAGVTALIALLRFSVTARVPFAGAVAMAVLTLGFELMAVFVVALIINALASYFHGIHSQSQALRVTAYASTPLWLSCVFLPFPTLALPVQFLAGLYHIYLMYLGLEVLMRSPRDRALGYATTVVLSSLILAIVFTQVGAGLGQTIRF
jgi:Yip1 domain